jgi:hypothetical protein
MTHIIVAVHGRLCPRQVLCLVQTSGEAERYINVIKSRIFLVELGKQAKD